MTLPPEPAVGRPRRRPGTRPFGTQTSGARAHRRPV